MTLPKPLGKAVTFYPFLEDQEFLELVVAKKKKQGLSGLLRTALEMYVQMKKGDEKFMATLED